MGHKIVEGCNQFRGQPEDNTRRGANIPTIGGKRAWAKALKEKRAADQMTPHLKVVKRDGKRAKAETTDLSDSKNNKRSKVGHVSFQNDSKKDNNDMCMVFGNPYEIYF